MEKKMESVFGLVSFVAVIPWSGWVASVLWGWFVVPLGVRPIGVFWASGLVAIGKYMFVPNDIQRRESKEFWTEIWAAAVRPAVFLGVGALYHWLAR